MNKSILLIISGSIAAYKALDLIRRLREENISVTTILTKSGAQFVTPLSVAALSGEAVYDDLFSLKDESEMGHIRLSREHDLVVVAPASADILAKMAHGMANDLATATLLATNTPVIAIPAMNPEMWQNPATQRNIKQLQTDGIQFIGPESGLVACGEEGFGRFATLDTIIDGILSRLKQQNIHKPLSGKTAIVTCGPTYEAIDPVRFIGNRSSGKQGIAIANALTAAGAKVTLVSGPVSETIPASIAEVIYVESAAEMLSACESALPADIAICAAAVADWRPAHITANKIKKDHNASPPEITLTPTTDILQCLSQHEKFRPSLVIGFAAETDNLLEKAIAKRARKGCDWIIANDVSADKVFGKDTNEVLFITKEGHEAWPQTTKTIIAERLVERIAETLNSDESAYLENSLLQVV